VGSITNRSCDRFNPLEVNVMRNDDWDQVEATQLARDEHVNALDDAAPA
jgi:hypothetical protein